MDFTMPTFVWQVNMTLVPYLPETNGTTDGQEPLLVDPVGVNASGLECKGTMVNNRTIIE